MAPIGIWMCVLHELVRKLCYMEGSKYHHNYHSNGYCASLETQYNNVISFKFLLRLLMDYR